MNEQNYGSREACQRLVEAGIVLETDASRYESTLPEPAKWMLKNSGWKDGSKVPASSMAEAWRELPEKKTIQGMLCSLMIYKRLGCTCASYWWHEEEVVSFFNTTPTDALIDLLIWVKKETKP